MTLRSLKKHLTTASSQHPAATRNSSQCRPLGWSARGPLRPWLTCLTVTLASLFFSPALTMAQTGGSPMPLNVAENAQPIWSPNRPADRASTSAANSSNTLRLVQNGWGQNRGITKTAPTTNVLRWKSHKPTAPTGISSIPLQAANWQQQQQSTEDSQIRTVSHDEPNDPFANPFGDRLAQRSIYDAQPPSPNGADSGIPAPSLDDLQNSQAPEGLPSLDELLGPGVDEPTESMTPPATAPSTDLPSLPESEATKPVPPAELLPSEGAAPTRQPAPLPADDTAPSFQGPASSTPTPKPSNTAPPRFESSNPPFENPAPLMDAPAPSDQAQADSCRRNYAGRDCCIEDKKCHTARQVLQQNSIRNISLDITATFKPNAETEEEEEQAEQDRLRQMPSRVWKNANGQFVAEGRVVDLHNRRIVVQQPDGSEKTLKIGDLDDDCTCFLAAWWQVPTDCSLGNEQYIARNWTPQTFTWKASALCHKPLYFEERQLERYGHMTGPFTQPVLSGAHFFLNVAVLPYKMGINPPIECQYPLGYYRPGSCSPWLLPPVPLSLRGALFQAGAVTGVALLLP